MPTQSIGVGIDFGLVREGLQAGFAIQWLAVPFYSDTPSLFLEGSGLHWGPCLECVPLHVVLERRL